MEEYLEMVVRPLLKVPEEFQITKLADDLGVLLTLDISYQDMPVIIGKEGQNIDALRRIMSMYGVRTGSRISVKVNEPVGGKHYKE